MLLIYVIYYIVGGIYTVIRTKVPITVNEFGQERYYLLGPLSHRSAALEVENTTPTNPVIKDAIDSMTAQGIRVVHGKWLVESAPNVILFDLGSAIHRLNEWKADIWEKASVPSPDNDFEMNDAIVFGYLVAWFLGEV